MRELTHTELRVLALLAQGLRPKSSGTAAFHCLRHGALAP